jgi:hypothetical protein
MTVFEQGEKADGDWFPFFTSKFDPQTGEIIYDSPVDGSAEFCFRSLVPFWEERQKGRQKEYKMVVNPLTRAMDRVGYYPDLSFDEAKRERDNSWDYAITGMKFARWTEDGPEMDCTRENKLKLVKNSSFLRFANRVLQLLHDTGVKKKEDAEKNL